MTKRKNSAPDSIITKRVKLDIEERSIIESYDFNNDADNEADEDQDLTEKIIRLQKINKLTQDEACKKTGNTSGEEQNYWKNLLRLAQEDKNDMDETLAILNKDSVKRKAR